MHHVASDLVYKTQLPVSKDPSQRHSYVGIICTIGPACVNVDTLTKMITNGMNVARLNFSHGTHDYHKNTIDLVRKVNEGLPAPYRKVAIALDTKGPEIRTGIFQGDFKIEVKFRRDQIITITTDEKYRENQTETIVWVDYKNIAHVLDVGKKIYIDDGLISLVVVEVIGDELKCSVENGGVLGSKKGVNLPGSPVDLPAVSEQDKKDLLFGVEQGVDAVFASFIRDGQGVRDIRAVLGEQGKNIKIISKIESMQGIDNFDDILAESDGVMVARGDLGIEIPPEQVFLAQKKIVAKCNVAGKSVIIATQMLESMTHKPRPTRAEASDVANAVLDGADCVMLSGETAKGKYPVECVRMMEAICLQAESSVNYLKMFQEHRNAVMDLQYQNDQPDPVSATAIAAVEAAFNVKAAAIIVLTRSGDAAAKIAQFNPRCPVIAVCRDAKMVRQMHFYRGILPVFYDKTNKWTSESDITWADDVEERVKAGIEYGHTANYISSCKFLSIFFLLLLNNFPISSRLYHHLYWLERWLWKHQHHSNC